MKTTLVIFLTIACISSVLYAVVEDGYTYATTPKEKADLIKKCKTAFIGHAEILGMRYLGVNGRVLTPEEVAASKPGCIDPLYYPSDSPIRNIEFTVKLVADRILKGKMPPSAVYRFTYRNSLIVMFDNQPRSLHKGGKMEFYIIAADGDVVSEIAYGGIDANGDPGEQDVPSDGHKPSNRVPSDGPTAPADAH